MRRQNHAAARAVSLVSRGKVSLKQMITHRFKAEKIGEAFELVKERKDGVIKAVIEI